MELSLPRLRLIQLTSKPWPLSKIIEQKHRVCLEVHPSKLATFQLEFSAPLSQQNSENTFFAFAQHIPPWEAHFLASHIF
jgi:hypothetical protein